MAIDVGVAAVPPRDVLQAAFGRLTTAVLLAFVASVPAEYTLILPGIGSISRLLGLALILLVLLDVLGGRRLRTPGAPQIFLAAFTAWSALSLAWSIEPAQTLERAVTYLQLLVMAWIVCEYVRTEAEFVKVLTSFVAGALFMAGMTIREFSLVNLAALAITDLRVSAFGANPNELGLTLAITVPAALYLLRRATGSISRLIGGAYLVLGPVAVLLSASRSAVIVLVLVVPGLLRMLRDAHRRVKLGILIGVACMTAVVASILPVYTWDRLATIGVKLQRMDLNNRTDNWQAGFHYLADSPFIGVGAGAFQGAAHHMRSVAWSSHSSWLGVLVETGLVGAALWFTGIGIALFGLRRAAGPLRVVLLAMALPMMIGMFVTGWDHRKVPWFVFSLMIVAPLLWSEGRSRQGQAAVS